MVAQTAKIEAGHVHIPKEAAWIPDFLNEALAFPRGKHDDQVDALSQFLDWAAFHAYVRDTGGFGMPVLITADGYDYYPPSPFVITP